MKTILTCIGLLFFCSDISTGSEIQSDQNPTKTTSGICGASKITQADSIPDYSISINGKQNKVTIATDSLTRQTTETKNKKPNGIHTIEINGESNSVSVNQENEGTVSVKQNGKNNQINISQKTSNP